MASDVKLSPLLYGEGEVKSTCRERPKTKGRAVINAQKSIRDGTRSVCNTQDNDLTGLDSQRTLFCIDPAPAALS